MVELMIVIAVIGVIASLAIPNYMRFTARTKRSEMLETISKIKLNFKNLADNSGTFVTGSTVAAGVTSVVNPTGTVPVGQGTNWDTHADGWTEFQFPPEGSVKMRYWYTMGPVVNGNVQDVTITVCGSFAGLGSTPAICPSQGSMVGTANYRYDEVFHANGSSDPPVEIPAF
jgi:type II secretory pathway pseudopilin PulG